MKNAGLKIFKDFCSSFLLDKQKGEFPYSENIFFEYLDVFKGMW